MRSRDTSMWVSVCGGMRVRGYGTVGYGRKC